MVGILSAPVKILSALVIAGAMAMTFLSPAEAQTAKKLKCKGCVKSKQIKNNAIKGKDIRDGSLTTGDLSNEAGGDFDVNVTLTAEVIPLPLGDTVFRTVSLTAPSAGQVIVNASLAIEDSIGSPVVRCSISKGTAIDFRTIFGGRLNNASGVTTMTLGTTWGESVAPGTQTWNLVCDGGTATTTTTNPALTIIFLPTRY